MSQINVNVVAPLGYTGPLSMGAGYVLTVPTSTTLNIL